MKSTILMWPVPYRILKAVNNKYSAGKIGVLTAGTSHTYRVLGKIRDAGLVKYGGRKPVKLNGKGVLVLNEMRKIEKLLEEDENVQRI